VEYGAADADAELAAAAAHATAAPEPELMPRDPAEAGGGTSEAGGAVIDVVAVELVLGGETTLTEEVEPNVPVVDVTGGGGEAALAAAGGGGGTLDTAGLLETTPVVEVVVLPAAGTGAAAGVFVLVSCLFSVKPLMFLGNLRMSSETGARASTGADSDRGTAISRLTLMGRAAALVTAIARRTKEGA
jgi:hypothetical protein